MRRLVMWPSSPQPDDQGWGMSPLTAVMPAARLSRMCSQPALIEELHQVAFALLVGAQCRQIGGELRRCAQSLVTVPDFDQQGGDLLVDRVAGLGPERFDRTQVDWQGVGRPIRADEVGEGEPLAFAGDAGSRVPRRGDVTVVDQRT